MIITSKKCRDMIPGFSYLCRENLFTLFSDVFLPVRCEMCRDFYTFAACIFHRLVLGWRNGCAGKCGRFFIEIIKLFLEIKK